MRVHTVAVAVLAITPVVAAQVGSSSDLWDFSRGAVVTAHSSFDDTHGGYDARDAFGGTCHDFAPEFGAVVFADFQQPGSIHFLEWRTPAPVDLERFTMTCSADHHAEDLRATASFRLYAREEAGAPWILLHEAVRNPADILDHPFWLLDHEFETPCRGLREFRAEFIQACANTEYGGPRVHELDGFGEYTWAAHLARTGPDPVARPAAPSAAPAGAAPERRYRRVIRLDAPEAAERTLEVTTEIAAYKSDRSRIEPRKLKPAP